jgi:hypothetical protein
LLAFGLVVACVTQRVDPPPEADAGGGSCLDDPIGQSQPPENCSLVLPGADDCASAVPSFDLDIGPILARRCKLCHTRGGPAARVLFDTYDEAYGSYKLMYSQVLHCVMPPSCAGPLPDEERQKLLKWFVCKAPPGPFPVTDAGTDDGDTRDGDPDAGAANDGSDAAGGGLDAGAGSGDDLNGGDS